MCSISWVCVFKYKFSLSVLSIFYWKNESFSTIYATAWSHLSCIFFISNICCSIYLFFRFLCILKKKLCIRFFFLTLNIAVSLSIDLIAFQLFSISIHSFFLSFDYPTICSNCPILLAKQSLSTPWLFFTSPWSPHLTLVSQHLFIALHTNLAASVFNSTALVGFWYRFHLEKAVWRHFWKA